MTVFLVGAGPGDPGLLTRRGAELLSRADVVVHDRLVDRSLLALVRTGAELVDVGKWPGHSRGAGSAGQQDEINALLIEHGRAGRLVVRLKGGDPFLFGRGGEEVEALVRAGVDCEVVPGVPSAFAVPAIAGVPVTYRGLAAAVTVVTGRVGDPGGPSSVDWAALARGGGTLVILMGVATRAEIAERLMAGGRAPDTPVAVIERGTTAAEVRITTTLKELGRLSVQSPAVVVVGPVAALDLGRRVGPLAGWRVVVTRATERAGPLADALAGAGARVMFLAVIETTEPADGGTALRKAATAVSDYDWVAFTSASSVERFVPLLRDGRSFGRTRIAAVGGRTQDALAAYHLIADLVPEQTSAAGLAEALVAASGPGRVLFPRAAGAGPDLPDGLAAQGWRVDGVDAYETVRAPAPSDALLAEASRADAITFTSPSTVAAYLAFCDQAGASAGVPAVVACLGPATARAARAAGLEVAVQAPGATVDALVGALVAYRRAETNK